MSDIQTINIEEFRTKGYLQELNRQFLHPLGLALEISIDENGEETLGNIWDYRDDLEGIYYGLSDSSKTRIDTFKTKSEFIENELALRNKYRQNVLGFDIEPIK